ncbi:Eco57I restriction-modification methylase domain-containing protein [Anaerovorax odorimutans]|uniref:site-specific DNA-methyltransferase (adenine-specific) n=1 Tax=Anaerovorax odorimutans TaxID=109327 RepID=A0ABT1RNF5_9FIRM|nr:Eco57I restriction-modification methylase domain-containing protein [Anaerovorax odorimutans]MCQ4636723.1 Eco57I restriction-modification methylase domain-containing protein [Anaerovorax odorimutans]
MKSMDDKELKRLVEQYEKSRAYYKDSASYNEQNCRDEFISPLLECFGWDVHNKNGTAPQYREVVVEKFSNENERPDYTLTLNGVSKMFMEAKKPAVDITADPSPAAQARRYGWNAKHKLSILTNFEYMLIYDTTNRPQGGDTASTSLFRKYHYLEYPEKFSEIAALISRDAVYSGEFDQFTGENFQNAERFSAEVDETFLRQINEWRLAIGKYLYEKYETYRDIDVLNDAVQEFINQIIFLRICEDRNLPLYRSLKDAARNKEELQDSLTRLFREVDKRYNSGLFSGETIIFDLSNEITFGMILSLYYPQSPYLFNIIEPEILGKIYEAFLAESLILEDGQIALSAKKEYKYRSVVSTPVEIVKYMVKNTLQPVCQGKTPEEVKELQIADIACGSGVFLEETYQFLIDYCAAWYAEHKPEYLIELSNGRRKLPLTDKKDILTSCVYGVDIDMHAVEVCKFSLLIKLIEDETPASVSQCVPILPDLTRNIKNGNSLVARADIGEEDASIEMLREIKPFEWESVNEGRGFDIILGNPPYVKTEDIHGLETGCEFGIYKRKYKSAYKQFDKYYLFIEKAFSLLKEDGRLCYIVPNKFYKIGAGRELRKLLSAHIAEIDDFGDMQLFPDKTIYSSIILAHREPAAKLKYARVDSVTELWAGETQESITIENKTLDSFPWRLSTDLEFMKMIARVEGQGRPLGEVADIFNGIQTSAERPEPVYWFGRDEILSETDEELIVGKFQGEYHIEKDILKPYFKPTKADEKGMDTYSLLKTDKHIIFPYNTDGSLIDLDTMKSKYPGTYEYLLDCYELLVPKCLNGGVGRDIKNAAPDTWHQYGRTQALTAFINTPKLIVRVLSKAPMYAYDKNDMLIASGGTAGYCAIATPPDCKYDLAYIQAWLNHPYTEKLFQIMGSDFEGGFTARGTYLLKRIPFVDLDFNDESQRDRYEAVVKASKRIYQLNEALELKQDKATTEVIRNEKENLMKQIEENITKIYKFQF